MSDIVVSVDKLSKQYRLGSAGRSYKMLRDSLSSVLSAPVRSIQELFGRDSRSESATLWALKDVSFEVKRGEVLGIIGHNGAGKSTLLKILSRITEPTSGGAEVHGRISALLEVGTGFHPELTGRENIFLNGAILGMRRGEIERKFDEIVAFAEVERFLETPVKHYSSGMHMRLAFSVAAHLEPEILVVDEVLAVGDAAFQKKCLGKLQTVSAESGRTVLFVSHNMQALRSLCTRVLYLERGQIVDSGAPGPVVARYLSKTSSVKSYREWNEDAPGNHEIRLKGISVSSGGGGEGVYSSSIAIDVEMTFEALRQVRSLVFGFDIVTPDGVTVFRTYQTDQPEDSWPTAEIGMNRWRCSIPAGLLNAGTYYACPKFGVHKLYWIGDMEPVVRFEILLDHGVSLFWNSEGGRPGVIAPILRWAAVEDAAAVRIPTLTS